MRVAEQVIPPALKYFDLLDVVAAIARRVTLSSASNPLWQRLARSQAAHEYTTALSAYKSAGAAEFFELPPEKREEESLQKAMNIHFGYRFASNLLDLLKPRRN